MVRLICIFSFLLLARLGFGQIQDSTRILGDTLSDPQIRKVEKYWPDSCIYQLLKDVVHAHEKSYSVANAFYSLSFDETAKYRYMTIDISRWGQSGYNDYQGYIKIGDAIFLLRGDFK